MNYYDEIKNILIDNELLEDYSKNRDLLNIYYEVGKLLTLAQGGVDKYEYGDKLIRKYSDKLVSEVNKKYDYKNLYSMREFYLLLRDDVFFKIIASEVTWNYYLELLSIKDIDEISYYIFIILGYNVSVNGLKIRIKSKEYQKLYNKYTLVIFSGYMLKRMILYHLDSLLLGLGCGFTYARVFYDNGDDCNHIDLFLYNDIFKRYVTMKFKIAVIMEENIGKVEIYSHNYVKDGIKLGKVIFYVKI